MASAIAEDTLADLQARGDREADAYADVAISVHGTDCPIGSWIRTLPAYNVLPLRGVITQLLLTSWDSVPAGTLPADDESLAAISGLPVDQFSSQRRVLLNGWDVVNDRIRFPVLAERARYLVMEHGEALRRLQAEVSVASIAPGAFQLRSVQPAGKRTRRSKLPADFVLHNSLVVWGAAHLTQTCERQGATGVPTSQDIVRVLTEMLSDFKTHAKAKSWLYDDWDAAFRNFVASQVNGDFTKLASFYFPDLFPAQPLQRVLHAPRVGYVPVAQAVREGLDTSVEDAMRRMGMGVVPDAGHDDRTIDADFGIDVDAPLMRSM